MTPDLTKKVIGFRQWNATEDAALAATWGGQVWGRGPNKAKCEPRRDDMLLFGYGHPQPTPGVCEHAPGPCGNCGLYALHDFPEALVQDQGPYRHGQASVMGAVAAWGKLEVHRAGFRAEFAEVVALGYCEAWPAAWVERVERCARSYDVPHLPGRELAKYAAMVGEPVPESLYPEKPKPEPVPKAGALSRRSAYLSSLYAHPGIYLPASSVHYGLSGEVEFKEPPARKQRRIWPWWAVGAPVWAAGIPLADPWLSMAAFVAGGAIATFGALRARGVAA